MNISSEYNLKADGIAISLCRVVKIMRSTDPYWGLVYNISHKKTLSWQNVPRDSQIKLISVNRNIMHLKNSNLTLNKQLRLVYCYNNCTFWILLTNVYVSGTANQRGVSLSGMRPLPVLLVLSSTFIHLNI